MSRNPILALALLFALGPAVAAAPARAQQPPSDDQIRDRIIAISIAEYPGICACPYSLMRSGRKCGKRSAYSKPGGYEPKCYRDDVSDEMVRDYRRRMQK
jgi:hypothetical protein